MPDDIYGYFNRVEPFGFRTIHPGNAGGREVNTGFHSISDLGSFFQDHPDHVLKQIFFRTKSAPVFNRILRSIPLEKIIRTMEHLAKPVFMEYVETTRNGEFLDVSFDFFRSLYWGEIVFLSYNLFDNPSGYEISGDEYEEIEYLRWKGGFDLWFKLSGKVDDKDTKFIHLNTGREFNIPNWHDRLIMVKWPNKNPLNFISWFEYSIKWIIGFSKINHFENVLLKRVSIEGTENLDAVQEDVSGRLENPDSIITNAYGETVKVRAKVFADGSDLSELRLSVHQNLDREIFELGRVANTNPKGERLTSGENYKDITSISARQKSVLDKLEFMAGEIKKMWGIDLEFAINGVPEKELLKMHEMPAKNPNQFKTGAEIDEIKR